MAPRPPTLLHGVLMGWLTITFVLAWLPLVRSLMDGVTYEWGTRYFGVPFSGAGLMGDFWLLVGLTALGLWLLYRGWRDPSGPFSAVLLAWLGFVAADSIHLVVTAPERYRFEGATLGVNVALATVAPLLHVGFFGLALWWVPRKRASAEPGTRPAWTGTNSALLGLVVLLFPVQFLLLRSGQGQEAKDVIGVLLTVCQWLLISAALYPWCPSHAARAERSPAPGLPT